MATERERFAKIESRAREADNALQQLNGYIALLKKKSTEVSFSEEARQLEAENVELRKEVSRLKQQLILEEIRNGVEQYPVPANVHSSKAQSQAMGPSKQTPPISKPPPTKQPPASENSDPPKKAKVKQTEKKKGGGNKDTSLPVDVSRLDMRVGKIMKAWKHPDADGLYVEEVDVGEEGRIRTVCSGLVNHIPLEEMQGRLGVFLCNLKTAKMRGVPSEAMIMCASTPEKIEIIDPPSGSQPGDRVFCVGYEGGDPDPQLNPKKKVFEAVQPDLHTNQEGVACYKGAPFTVEGKGICRSQTMKATGIK